MISNLEKNIVIQGYPNELIQCFMNIFNNAKNALKDIQDKKYIFLSTRIKHDNIIITFRDNAGGIPRELIDKIFEPYFTTKHKSQGTGLGLSMTYNIIVDGMNGLLEVDNISYLYQDDKYKGAQFTITLKKDK